jgi:hypothetical protein
MTRWVGALTLAVAVLLVIAWSAGIEGRQSPPLRSEHSRPAASAPDRVTVTEAGKLFHRATCTAIHGPSRSIAGSEAIADGYTPCPRCLPER